MAACTEVLRVNRDMIDNQFEGYKLSLDVLPTYQISFDSGLDIVRLRDDEYTLQHMQLFGVTNHLMGDLWYPNCVYFVDSDWNVLQQRVVLESQLTDSRVVFTIPECDVKRTGSRHNVSMHFTSPGLCVLSDGAGLLYVLGTGNRDSPDLTEWKVLCKEEVCNTSPAIVQHSVYSEEGSKVTIQCILLHVEKKTKDDQGDGVKSKSDYATYLEWITLSADSDKSTFKIESSRQLRGSTAPTYCGFEERGQALFVVSESDFKNVAESPMEEDADATADQKGDAPPKLYSWTQTMEDITLRFTVAEATTKHDIHIVMQPDRVEIGLKDKPIILSGALYRLIDVSASTWTLEGRNLEMSLAKQDEGVMWTEAIVGNSRGEYVADPALAEQIHERLAHLTSDQLNPDPSGNVGGRPGMSPQDLEECDVNPENTLCLYRIEGEHLKITNKASLASHQRLFNAPLQPHMAPSLCLRHDVDGIVWQPSPVTEDSPSPWQHVATFNALGYVQASKRNCKFAGCAPDTSYCVLCDCSKHAYIYRQPADLTSPIRNRKSGRVIGQIAKQQVVNLDTNDDVHGMQVTNERLFILTNKKLYIIRVKLE